MPTVLSEGLDAAGGRITNLGAPSVDTDATNKGYVDATARGFNALKTAARVRTSTNITIASPGATLDGVTMAAGDRVLVAGQTTASQNGVYVWNGAAVAMTRATDADVASELLGMSISVMEGTSGDTTWLLTTDGPITVGTTSLTYAVLAGAGLTTAGSGLTSTGPTVNVGQGAGITVSADDVAINTSVVSQRFATSIGDGTATTIVVTHNLGTTDVMVTLRRLSDSAAMLPSFSAAHTANTVTLSFSTAPAANGVRVNVTTA